MNTPLFAKLAAGDRRSIGPVAWVVKMTWGDSSVFPLLIEGLTHKSDLVRMRCADAVEKISRKHPEWLQPYAKRLLGDVAAIPQQEVRWHVAQLLPRLKLDARKRQRAVRILLSYLDDPSSIVRTFAMQALTDIAAGVPALRRKLLPLIEDLTRTGTPAMKARGRKLLEKLR